MAQLQGLRPDSFSNIALGPGIVCVNLPEITIEAINAARRGDEGAGRMVGALTAAPTFSASPEVVDLMENVVGASFHAKGSKVLQRLDVTMAATMAELSNENLHMLIPGMDESNWLDAAGTNQIGTMFQHRGFWDETDYVDNMVMVLESANQPIHSVIEIRNAIMTEESSFEFEDDGNVSGIEGTFQAHVDLSTDFDYQSGRVTPPFTFYRALAEPVAVTP